MQKIKSTYLVWLPCYQAIPKVHRYTLGGRVDTLLIEAIEATTTAGFLPRSEKLPFVRIAMRKVDTIKVLLLVLWETKSLDIKKYAAVSGGVDEIGKMLGGWNGQLVKYLDDTRRKQNSPNPR